LAAWVDIERVLQASVVRQGRAVGTLTFPLEQKGSLPAALDEPSAVAELNQLRRIRNTVVQDWHSPSEMEVQLLENWVRKIEAAVGAKGAG